MLYGIDISSYQGDLDVRRLSNVSFVIIKATEGTAYVNPHCDTQYQEAKAAGVLRGVYHFAADKANSAKGEAAYFVNNVRGYIGDALLALDNENSTYNTQGNVGWCLEWLQEVERLTGVKPLIYMNASCVNSFDWSPVINNGNALWVAAYQGSAPDVNWPNSAQAEWQFTSTAHVAGYSGDVDEDVFWGDADGWKAYATAHAAPAPAPTPEPPVTPPAPVEPTPAPAPATDTPPTSDTPQSEPQQPTDTTEPAVQTEIVPTWLGQLIQGLWAWITSRFHR